MFWSLPRHWVCWSQWSLRTSTLCQRSEGLKGRSPHLLPPPFAPPCSHATPWSYLGTPRHHRQWPTKRLLATVWYEEANGVDSSYFVILLLANEQCFNHSIKMLCMSFILGGRPKWILNCCITLSLPPWKYITCHYIWNSDSVSLFIILLIN